ncbi:resolvase [Candidatus Margulisiibacteriota bacterium]
MIIAIDPGTEKIGIAVLDVGKVYYRLILSRATLVKSITEQLNDFSISEIVIGGSTGSAPVLAEVRKSFPNVQIECVPETSSTLDARKRYWKENSPRGFLRLIPCSLLTPPRPIDDYAAIIIGERYLKTRED